VEDGYIMEAFISPSSEVVQESPFIIEDVVAINLVIVAC